MTATCEPNIADAKFASVAVITAAALAEEEVVEGAPLPRRSCGGGGGGGGGDVAEPLAETIRPLASTKPRGGGVGCDLLPEVFALLPGRAFDEDDATLFGTRPDEDVVIRRTNRCSMVNRFLIE